MKNIKILTFHSVKNYGAVLQTFALYVFLKNKYNNVQIINFSPDNITFKPNWKSPLTFILYLKFYFFKRKMKFTTPLNAETFRKSPPRADVYIVGSDQVWNPNITKENQDIYFLDCIPDSQYKIAYAASFGQADFNENDYIAFRKYIHGFKAISVREETGRFILNKLNQPAICVLDPVFLINDYTKYFKLKPEKTELGLFILNNSSTECFEIAKFIANEVELIPKIINKNRPIKGFKNIPIPSVNCFLSEIHSSRLIITNSFHGLAFSIIFKKNFIFVCTDSNKSTRAISLLEKLCLMDRFFYNYSDVLHSKIWKESIDYIMVDQRLGYLKEQSVAFIQNNV